jgi:hypothetical protein
MNTRCSHLEVLFVSTFMLMALLASSYYQAMNAQLEIPEDKPVENNGANNSTLIDTSDYLVFDEPGLGYSITYPNDWKEIALDRSALRV